MFLVCSKYLNIVIYLYLPQCFHDNFEPLGQAVDLDVEVVGSHRLFVGRDMIEIKLMRLS